MGAQGLVGHARTKITAPDSDVDDRGESMSRRAATATGVHIADEGPHARQHAVDLWGHVHSIDHPPRARGSAQDRMTRGSALGEIHDGTVEQTADGGLGVGHLGDRQQHRDHMIVDQILRQVDHEVTEGQGQLLDTTRIRGEEPGDRTGPIDGDQVGPRFRRLDTRHLPDASGEPPFGSAE